MYAASVYMCTCTGTPTWRRSSQITVWLQCLFFFALVWSLGGTMTGDSRKTFDVFYRTLVSGTDQDHPRPKTVKLSKVCICGHIHTYIHAGY